MSPAPHGVADHPGQRLAVRKRPCVAVAAELQALDQCIAVDALDRRLAGRIDRRDDDRVGIVEAGAEAVEEVVQPGIAVGLDDRR